MRDGEQALCKLGELTEIARDILGGSRAIGGTLHFRMERNAVVRKSQPDSRIEALMIAVYGDESHDTKCERVFTVAILFASPETWESLESKWKDRNGIPFHANDCDSDRGDFAPKPGEDEDKKHKENKSLYKENTILLADSGVSGFASNVDLQAQEKYLGPLAIKPADSYYKCFWDVIEMIQGIAGQAKEIAECTFDTRAETEYNAGFLYGQLRECYPQWAPRLASRISFECSEKNPRIQIADLWAREAMKALDNDIGPKKRTRRAWEKLRETQRFLAFSYSENWFRDFSADFQNAQRRLGFSQDELTKWLREKRVQPNFANIIRFLNPLMKKHSKNVP